MWVGPEIKFGYIRENGLPHFMWPWRGTAGRRCAACSVRVCDRVSPSNEVVAGDGGEAGEGGESLSQIRVE